MDAPGFELLLHGIDTLQAAYYLTRQRAGEWDFAKLLQTRESLRVLRSRDGAPLTLGGVPFVLASHGTGSGYPLLASIFPVK